jgi:NAD(P) transhydrogenase subunit beta
MSAHIIAASAITAASIADAAYIVAALLFILALAGLSKHETSRQGITFGISGMTIALAATINLAVRHVPAIAVVLLVVAVAIGGAIGIWRARIVEMTGMPELIALLHSFVGLAAVLVGWDGYYSVESKGSAQHEIAHNLLRIHHAEVFIGVFIGAVTFTGSIVAFLKLSARINSHPLTLPGKNLINLASLAAFAGLTIAFVAAATCQSSSRCSTATPAGPPPPQASCSTTTCSSSPEPSSAPPVPT